MVKETKLHKLKHLRQRGEEKNKINKKTRVAGIKQSDF